MNKNNKLDQKKNSLARFLPRGKILPIIQKGWYLWVLIGVMNLLRRVYLCVSIARCSLPKGSGLFLCRSKYSWSGKK